MLRIVAAMGHHLFVFSTLCALLTLEVSTTAAAGPGTTLQKGHYWIRAVTQPNFHKYLQTKPILSPGTAILGDYTTAGQFAIQNGQFVELISSPGEPAKYLYATVSENKTRSDMTRAVSFSPSPNKFGSFVFSGDAVQWLNAADKRGNPSAWYVCEGKQLFVNLGAYGYKPPAVQGVLKECSDHTIHYYNDAKANP